MGISSPGIGSGLPVNQLVTSLMQPAQARLTQMQQQQQGYQTTLSAYGTLSSALSTFQSALQTLSSLTQFTQASVSSSDNTVLNAVSAAGAVPGTYGVTVSQMAQAQSLTAGGVADQTAAIGTGTITLSFGTISGGTLTNGTYSGATFTQNNAQSPVSITIDNTNDSLQGIRDAINAANAGVTASIVNDGSSTPYRLVLTSTTTGANESMNIAVSPSSGGLANLLSYNAAGTQNLTQSVAAQNAQLTVNGLAVTSASNTVSGAIQGVNLSLIKTGTVTVSASNNTTGVTNSINGFVQAYNALQGTINQLTVFDPTGKNNGPLIGDSTVQLIQNQLRALINTKLPGVAATGLSNLAQVGITFQKDGTLAVNSTTLQNAVNNNFSQLASLFATNGVTTDSLVSYATSTSNTVPGQYAVNITQAATQGSTTGNNVLASTTTIDTTDNTLNLTLDNVSSTVTIPSGSYTASALATAIQTAINANSAFTGVSSSVTANANGGVLGLTSNRYGSASNISITGGNGAALFGTTTNTTGQDVAGTIGGYAAIGTGQTLTGVTGEPTSGLAITVQGSATGARGQINFSQGYATLLSNQVTNFSSTNGALTSRTNSINQIINGLTTQETQWQQQMNTMQQQYLAQFTALDATMAKLQSTSSYLSQVLGNSSSSSSSGSSSSSSSSSGSSGSSGSSTA